MSMCVACEAGLYGACESLGLCAWTEIRGLREALVCPHRVWRDVVASNALSGIDATKYLEAKPACSCGRCG